MSHGSRSGFSHPPKETMASMILNISLAKKLGQARRKERQEAATKYLAETHTFQLFRGDTPFGAPKEMTGRAAKELNAKFERKFFDDKAPNARLWHWKLKVTLAA